MKTIRILFIVAILTNLALAGQYDNYDGRHLPGGIWQTRNPNATQQEPPGQRENPFEICTEWGTDIRLSYTEPLKIHNPEIAVWGNYIYVAWWNTADLQLDFARSTDLGLTWEAQQRISDNNDSYVGLPQIAAWDSCVYVVYNVGASWIYVTKSTDFGQTWVRRNIYRTGRNNGASPVIVARDSQLYCVFSILVDYVPPQDNDLFIYNSTDYGETWPTSYFVSDTIYGGIGPDMALNNIDSEPNPVLHLIRQAGIVPSTQEILYQRSIDGGLTWLGPNIISDQDTIHSQWPQIAAWGDSNVIATWMDYKYSDEAWTGDAFITRSSDNGETWSTPISMTSSHLIQSSDIAANGDTIILVYDQAYTSMYSVISANVSFDGGITWEGEVTISEGPERSAEPTVSISYNVAHVSWADSRDAPGHAYFEAYYDRGILDTTQSDIVDDGDNEIIPTGISVSAYPNPFNSKTIISVSNLKGGELEVNFYDITGRLVNAKQITNTTEGGEIKIVWDATDTSGKKVPSGIYFARASTPQTSKSINIIYLK